MAYHNIFHISNNPTMEELTAKYEKVLNDYCFDKENKIIVNIDILKLIIEAFEFYYIIINAKQLEDADDLEIHKYQYDHCYEIKYKNASELTKCDYIYLYSTTIIEQYGEDFVRLNEELFKKMIVISKELKEYEQLEKEKSKLS